MKSEKSFRERSKGNHGPEDLIRKAVKLEPIRKNGKGRHSRYHALEEEADEAGFDTFRRGESIFDYFDDET